MTYNESLSSNSNIEGSILDKNSKSSLSKMYLERDSESFLESIDHSIYRDPKVKACFNEYMDMTDTRTRRILMNLNEAEQHSVLTALTSKLYDNIVKKIDDIDYGDIPLTKGDITKLPNYDKIVECIDLLRDILKEFKQDTTPIDVISESLNNVITRKDLFTRAFRFDIELPIIMYNNTVLSIISSVSYMIATSIEFIKAPNKDSFQITLDKVSFSKTKNNMLFTNLKKFNKSCKNRDFDKAMEHVITTRIQREAFTASAGVTLAIAGVLLLLTIVPILREMVYLFYYSRMRVSEFFDIQSDLLQMNIYNLENNKSDMNDKDKQRIISKQQSIIKLFRKISNKISFTTKKAEVDTNKDVSNNSNNMSIDDVNGDSNSPLF